MLSWEGRQMEHGGWRLGAGVGSSREIYLLIIMDKSPPKPLVAALCKSRRIRGEDLFGLIKCCA